MKSYNKTINFATLNQRCCMNWSSLADRFAPGGTLKGSEYQLLNPHRSDRNTGSFMINVKTGFWADFSIGIKGRDWISFVAYMMQVSQIEAARLIIAVIGG